MTCPHEPLPPDWRVWRGPVPPELTRFAVEVRDRIGQYPYGRVVAALPWQGGHVGAFKSHHTWTYRGGVLITGICIPGVSLVVPVAATFGAMAPSAPATDLDTPDPDLAVFPAEPSRAGPWVLALALAAAAGLAYGAHHR